MHPMLNTAVSAARSAGRTMMRFIDRMDTIQVNIKEQQELVTEIDHMVERELMQIIQKAHPDHAFYSEETGNTAGNEYCWVIDPLDGTSNYVHGFPQFCISLAVKLNEKIEIGLVYDPVRHDLFTAARGHGANLNNHRIRVSQVKKLEEALIGGASLGKDPQHIQFYLQALTAIFPNCWDIRRTGSSALDLAYIAAGRLDGFFGTPLKQWNMAAGSLLIKEAGGLVSDFNGETHYLRNGNLIAGNPRIYKALLDIFQVIPTF